MNIIIKNGNEFFYESYWRLHKKPSLKDKDSFDFPFPYPFHNPLSWFNSNLFIKKLKLTELSLHSHFNISQRPHHCLLCDAKHITSGFFLYNNIIWENGLYHYIHFHNIKPSEKFIDFIFKFKTNKLSREKIILKGDLQFLDNTSFVKIHKNQLLILDALMKHGGYVKKYMDSQNINLFRYSEHAGLLDFTNFNVDKIIVAANTSRIDRDDEEIYLPQNIPYATKYEYIFHTHPPTPKPGGRSNKGILYEFPSVGDIFHFIDHFNDGKTSGSIIIASEGLYNIRKSIFNTSPITINEDTFYTEYIDLISSLQLKWISFYGSFSSYTFYSVISQNLIPIQNLNILLNKYYIHLDYFPRIKNNKGNWIIDTIYLPVYK